MDESSGRNVSTNASQSPHDTGSSLEIIPTMEIVEPIAGTSTAADANVPEVLVAEIEGKLAGSDWKKIKIQKLMLGSIYNFDTT